MSNVFVIDTNPERRHEVCRVLLGGEYHAEPFDSIAEFRTSSGSEGMALVHDGDGAIAQLCGDMRENPHPIPVIGYDGEPALERAVAAMQAGAASYLAWPFTRADFSNEMDRVGPVLRAELERKRRVARARANLAGLTAREREVLACLITHGTNKAIAKHLDISPRTVEKYRAAILKRLGVENTAQAIRTAVEGGALAEAPGD